MTAQTFDAPENDPTYRAALRHFQRGEWKAGLVELNGLAEKYPLDHELRRLRQEMQLRAKVDLDEAADRKAARMRRLSTLAVRTLSLLVLAGLAFFGWRIYSTWLQEQLQRGVEEYNQITRQAQLELTMRNLEEYLRADRLPEARQNLEKMQSLDPEYPGLAEAATKLEARTALEVQYQEAHQKVEAGDLPGALALFEAIEAQDAYRDVAIQIKNIKDQFQLSDFFNRAETAYQAGEWELAAARFKEVRRMEPNYNRAVVEDRLYDSLVRAAETLLVNEPESLPALQQALDYFKSAETLRPQDEATRLKRAEALQSLQDRLVNNYVEQAQKALAGKDDSVTAQQAARDFLLKAQELRPDDAAINMQILMADAYIKAQAGFQKNNWETVISSLEMVYSQEPNYAIGTARQTLYEAYIARGDAFLANGSLDLALGDYQRAAVLGEDSPDNSALMLYEARQKVAYLQGLLGNYEDSARVYLSSAEAINLQAELETNDPNLALKLRDAQAYLERGNYRNAYKLFKDLSKYSPKFTLMPYEVQPDETITSILNRYHSTLGQLSQVNPDITRRDSYSGLTILIPVRTGSQELSVPTAAP